MASMTKMDVWMIWAIDPDLPDSPWLVAAWDEVSAEENDKGWNETLATARKSHGAGNIRVTRTTVDYDAVCAAYDMPRV